METETLRDVLFPGLNLIVRQVTITDGNLMVDAAGCGPSGPCPQCQHPAERVHSRYWRHLAGLPAGGRRMIVRLRVRRFFCDQSQCRRRTYVEQVAGLTEPRLRTSTPARSAMGAVAAELGGRPGQRLCMKLRIHGRRTALLGQLKARPVPTRAPRLVGIDEFAFRKGRTYGTILVDVESSRPVDVLPDRETSTVAAWLREHPGAEIICRDRLMAFTKAIRQAAPEALEVADRWHLLQNLSTAVEKTCRRHRDCLRRPAGPEASPPSATPETPLLDRIRQRHAEVNELAAAGLSLNAIGRRLRLDRKTVRRYRKGDLAGLLASAQDRGHGVLEPFMEYVQHRFHAGCTSSMQLYREVLGLGYTGGYHVVHRYVVTIRKGIAVPARSATPRPRDISSWIMRPQESLNTADVAQLDAICGVPAQRSLWPATSRGSSPTCSANAAGTCFGTGSRRPSWAALMPSASSPTPSARTSKPSPPVSPCPIAPASSRATSTESKRSSVRCTAEPHSPCSERASSSSRSLHSR